MKRAIYALSADPITKGHMNIILRASNMFDELIVAIGNNPSKKYTLDKEKRLSIAKDVLKKYENIKVEYFSGALVDFAEEQEANIVVRGLRNFNDFQYEQELAAINKSLKGDLETCFILTEPNQAHVSSSSSKAIVGEYFSSSEYLPLQSKKALETTLNKQLFIGITGLMGSGKSFIAEQFQLPKNTFQVFDNQTKVHNVDLDLLCHQVYDESNDKYIKVREKIKNEFGTLERKEIGRIVFNDDEKLKTLNDIFRKPLQKMIREHFRNLKGVILINGATLVAENMLDLVNNQIIFVTADEDIRYERCLKGRNIPKEVLIERDKKMLTHGEQLKIVHEKIQKDGYGNIFILGNNKDVTLDNKIYSDNNLIIEALRSRFDGMWDK